MNRSAWVWMAVFVTSITPIAADPMDPTTGHMLERALGQLEDLRKQLPTLQYDAAVQVKEWDGKGRERGTAKATMTVRPGQPHSITYLSREVHGKVKLPDENEKSKDDDKDQTTLQQFAEQHRINDRFDFKISVDPENAARRIEFTPKPNQPEKNTADRFLDSIAGKATISEDKNRVTKFEMHILHPFQLFWIIAVLKEFSIEYELLEPKEFLGHAKVKVVFCMSTPIYTMRQQHDVEMDNFRRREPTVAAR